MNKSQAVVEGPDSLSGDESEPSEPPGSRRQTCQIHYQLETADCQPPSKGWLDKQLARIAQIAGVTKGEIGILLVDDERMSELHLQYSGIGGTTDILTFDHRDDPDDADAPMEADLVLCRDVAAREAAARGHEVRLELLLYAVHGLNHLLGGDDHTTAGAKAMHAWEDKMLTAAGFGAVFHRPAATAKKASVKKSVAKKSVKKKKAAKTTAAKKAADTKKSAIKKSSVKKTSKSAGKPGTTKTSKRSAASSQKGSLKKAPSRRSRQ